MKRGTLKEIPPELLPQGYYFHGFRYNLSLELLNSYNDNIFGTENNEESDLITTIKPSISVTKDYGRLSMVLNANAEFERYNEFSSENKNNYFAGLSGSFEATKSWQFPFSAIRSQRFRDRSSPLATSDTTTEPVRTDFTRLSLGAVKRFNRLSVGLIGDYTELDLEDGESLNTPGQSLVFSDNDMAATEARVELTYDFLREARSNEQPEHFLFANLRVGQQDFERLSYNGTGFNGLKRDRNTLGALVGFQTNYKDKIIANIGVGYVRQDFEDNSIESTQDLDFEADIEYLLMPKLLLGFTANREIEQDNDLLQGIVRSTYNLSAEYELQHNFYLLAGMGLATSDFAGESSREDTDLSGKIGLNYIFSPRLQLASEVFHLQRDSNEASSSLENTVVSVRLKGSL